MSRSWILMTLLLMILGLASFFILNDQDSYFTNETESNLLNKKQTKAKSISTPKKVVPLPTETYPAVKEQFGLLVQQASVKGIAVVITDGYRSLEEQERLYEKGRTTAGEIVTNAKGGESYHNYGLAIDFALNTPSGKTIWDMKYDGNKNGMADWTEVVGIAKSLGFEWGGDWEQFPDYPHLQMNYGLTIADLQDGQRPFKASLTADSSN
ncbi:M15 family metallopeptidase [Neobacillus sp. Marseille-QA0830]